MGMIQLGAIGLSFFLMAHTYGFTDLIQVFLFSLIIVTAFSEDSFLNRLCNGKVFNFLGNFSMIIFVTQCLAYSYPLLLPYPEQWELRYIMYIVYVMAFSLGNYWLVALLRKLCAKCSVKERLFIIDQEVE